MPEINWNALNQAPDVGQSVMQGFRQGQGMQQEMQKRNALAAYARNPDDPKAANALIQVDPELAIKIQKQQEERQRTAKIGRLQQRAATGNDPAALAELAGIDLDAWAKLDARTKAAIKEQTDYIGQAALAVSQLPEAQRAAAWDQYIDQGVQTGHPQLAEFKGKYSPQTLQGALAQAGQIKTFLDTQKIEYHQQGEQPSFATRAGTGQLIDPETVLRAGVISAGPGIAPTQQQRSLEEWAQDAIDNGADPAAVNRRLLELKGGAGQPGPQTFP